MSLLEIMLSISVICVFAMWVFHMRSLDKELDEIRKSLYLLSDEIVPEDDENA